jgi:hypothetical protein
MRHPSKIIAAALWIAAALLPGCGRVGDALAPAASQPPAASADEREVSELLALVPELAEDDLYLSEERTELGAVADAGPVRPDASPVAAIRPYRYWRQITSVDRRYEFEFFAPDSNGDPTRAFVTIHRGLRGTFNILTPTPAPEDTSKDAGAVLASAGDDPGPRPEPPELRLVQKRLHDHWVRRVALVRVARREGERAGWRIAGTSGVSVQSVTAATVIPPTRILSLRVEKAGLDTTITDPLELFRLHRIIHAVPGEEVRLTATTHARDNVVVLLHRGLHLPLRNNGDGTYSARWIVPRHTGIHHFGVNALSHGTLFDDQAPYQSDAWILPYVTAPIAAEVLP